MVNPSFGAVHMDPDTWQCLKRSKKRNLVNQTLLKCGSILISPTKKTRELGIYGWVNELVILSAILKDYWLLGISVSGGSNVNFQDLWKFVFSATGEHRYSLPTDEHRYSLPLDAMITHLMALSVSPILNLLAQPLFIFGWYNVVHPFQRNMPLWVFAYPNIFCLCRKVWIYIWSFATYLCVYWIGPVNCWSWLSFAGVGRK
jgi:hypothetical protein